MWKSHICMQNIILFFALNTHHIPAADFQSFTFVSEQLNVHSHAYIHCKQNTKKH